MRKIKKYNVSISEKSYDCKPIISTMKWKPTSLEIREIFNKLIEGFTICGEFKTNGQELYYKGYRKNDNWKSSSLVYIDLDNAPISWDELCVKMINELSNDNLLKPSFLYTSASHQLQGKGNRYRLVYVFDEAITDKELFEAIADYYNKEIKKYIGVEPDTCNRRIAQPCFGTVSNAHSFYLGNIIPVERFISGHNSQSLDIYTTPIDMQLRKMSQREKKDIFSKEEKVYYKNQSFTDYLNNNKEKYIIYKDNWYLLGDEAELKDVIYVEPIPRWNKETKQNDKDKIYHDGQRRKNEIKKASRRMRYINPQITKEELLYNVVYWMYRFTAQDNDPIRWEHLLDIVTTTMNETTEEYFKKRCKDLEKGDKLNKIINNPYTKPLIRERKRKIEIIPIEKQDEAFNTMENQSIEEIITELKVSKATAYRIKARNTTKIKTKDLVLKYMNEGKNKDEILNLTNISMRQLNRIIKALKESGAINVEINITNNNINNIGNDAIKYFKDEKSMKEFLKRFKTA